MLCMATGRAVFLSPGIPQNTCNNPLLPSLTRCYARYTIKQLLRGDGISQQAFVNIPQPSDRCFATTSIQIT